MAKYRLIITVREIRGNCPVFKEGDKFVIETPKLILEKSNAVCLHALSCISDFLIPLCWGESMKELGLSKEEGDVGYFRCLDPGPPYTEGASVLFEIRRERIE